uniref:Uncharacterized protein n=1 Tax=Chromera velia CCMP2878 TaxID=1169474 RepID=A0A0G4FZX1_9ALVE|eukprot:Cvel_19570.t1-p1 / transcript=Cvel_19570.t1 / gene=Cvel_19570 / organism=Chromera_velia_CCMP2878 / gene_product=hypothetical protein / transcript_product=hypothetical protein / location=Cvel_scaffold1697:31157-34899(-) / protein_length=457 / sequence_SO=supercontig / SO=protein_coding / is_pseudo=false
MASKKLSVGSAPSVTVDLCTGREKAAPCECCETKTYLYTKLVFVSFVLLFVSAILIYQVVAAVSLHQYAFFEAAVGTFNIWSNFVFRTDTGNAAHYCENPGYYFRPPNGFVTGGVSYAVGDCPGYQAHDVYSINGDEINVYTQFFDIAGTKVSETEKNDVIVTDVGTLLALGGISLDDVNPQTHFEMTAEAPLRYRQSGTVLLVQMKYKNLEDWNISENNYRADMSVKVQKTSWGWVGPVQFIDEDGNRYSRYRNAVRIRFEARGRVGIFDWNVFIALLIRIIVLLRLGEWAVTVVLEEVRLFRVRKKLIQERRESRHSRGVKSPPAGRSRGSKRTLSIVNEEPSVAGGAGGNGTEKRVSMLFGFPPDPVTVQTGPSPEQPSSLNAQGNTVTEPHVGMQIETNPVSGGGAILKRGQSEASKKSSHWSADEDANQPAEEDEGGERELPQTDPHAVPPV